MWIKGADIYKMLRITLHIIKDHEMSDFIINNIVRVYLKLNFS